MQIASKREIERTTHMSPNMPTDNKKEDPKEPDEKDSISEVIRSEVNLITFPFFALWDKDVTEKTETEYKTSITRGTQRLEVSWTVIPSPKYGHPGPFDREVHKAIEQIISELPLPIQNPIPIGSLYNLCKRMGIRNYGGSQYRKIMESLKRIAATTVESKGTFYSKEKEEWIEDIFHPYERIVLKGKKLPNGKIADTNYLFLNDWYIDNINAHYVKPIDWKYCRSLETPIAQRLYELLGIKFYGLIKKGGSSVSYRYSTLCGLLPVARQKYLSKAKMILDPAHKKLEETGFIAKWEWEKVPHKDEQKENDWLIKYYPGKRAEEEIKRFSTRDQLELELLPYNQKEVNENEAELSIDELDIINQLINRGMTRTIAMKLVNTHSISRLRRQIEIFDLLRKNNSPLIGKNPAGFLRKSIEEDYQPPDEYRIYLEREAKKRKKESLALREQSKEEEMETELMAIRAYKESLSRGERLELRKEAEAQIRNCGQYKEEFVTEYLIEAKENEIIRERIKIN